MREAQKLRYRLESEYPVKLWLSDHGSNNLVTISKIYVREDRRGEGVGSSVLQEIVDWADSNGKTLALTPEGPRPAALKRWYKRFGFVPNKGRKADHEIAEGMYRYPARKNPLLAEPPEPKHGELHRMGSAALEEVQDFFGDIDEDVYDVYSGVHVTPHPIVAASYALNRRGVDYNDFGLLDVTNPAVLIGLGPVDGVLDADGHAVAKHLCDVADLVEETGVDPDDIDDEEVADTLDLQGYTWGPEFYFDPYLGLSYVGGTFGNMPTFEDFVNGVRRLLGDGDRRALALEIAKEIVPQTRALRDVHEAEVKAVLVLPPYAPGGDDPHAEEAPFVPIEDFEGLSTPEEFDDRIADDALVLYGDPAEVDQWHGTNLVIARAAFPGIVTPKRVGEAEAFGSAYDPEDFSEEEEEE